MSTTSPSPIPFLILGLVTGGALLYVSYWVWPPSQRGNTSNNLRNNRRPNRRQGTTTRRTTTSNNNGSSSSTGGLRRSNATRRSRQPVAARRDDSRHYRSDGSSSDDGETSGYTTSRAGIGGDSDDDDTSDREYGTLDEDGYEKLPMDGSGKHDGLQLMNLLYAIAEDQAGKGTDSQGTLSYVWDFDQNESINLCFEIRSLFFFFLRRPYSSYVRGFAESTLTTRRLQKNVLEGSNTLFLHQSQ